MENLDPWLVSEMTKKLNEKYGAEANAKFKPGDVVRVLDIPLPETADKKYILRGLQTTTHIVDEIVVAPVDGNDYHCSVWLKDVEFIFSEEDLEHETEGTAKAFDTAARLGKRLGL